MLKSVVAKLKRLRHADRGKALEAWSLFVGREAAALWLEALAGTEKPSHI